ncbi:alpha/beta hydrolase [Marivita sp. S6314]|uniref:alpha/beta fold hydrolase n=1 Tax=Marivita sp. S6314 TaxID=2926406 RepID=UPI001FF24717|nr:alpha/beta hydrolase [Marivita sp. S6314]MCK0150864.1 alpha/beta hydrolase [Marivita sp. S6314]
MTSELPHYRISGSGEKTLFVLHGAYGDGRYFEDFADHIAKAGYRVVVWDCPGYGTSAPVEPATIERFAEAAQAMVQKEAGPKNYLLGHSMGALIGPYLANREPLIDGLILSAGSRGFAARTPEDQKRYMKERLAPIENGMSVRDYAMPMIASMMGKNASGPLVDKVFEVVLSMKTETFATSIRAIGSYDGRPALAELKTPTLMIAGREDPACTADGMKLMQEMVAGSTLHVIEDAGHYAFAEKPEEYRRLVLDFLAGTDA